MGVYEAICTVTNAERFSDEFLIKQRPAGKQIDKQQEQGEEQNRLDNRQVGRM